MLLSTDDRSFSKESYSYFNISHKIIGLNRRRENKDFINFEFSCFLCYFRTVVQSHEGWRRQSLQQKPWCFFILKKESNVRKSIMSSWLYACCEGVSGLILSGPVFAADPIITPGRM